MNKTLTIGLCMLLLLCVNAMALSSPQSSPTTGNALQILYPKIDFYKLSNTISFDFGVLDANSTRLDNTTTNCTLNLHQSNGTDVLYINMTFDGYDFTYNWNSSNLTTQQDLYYNIYCNQAVNKGYVSNNFRLNKSGQDDGFNSPAFIAILIAIFGMISILIIVAERLEFGIFEDDKGNVIPAFKYLAYLVSGWLLLIPIDIARQTAELYNIMSSLMIQTIYNALIGVMIFITALYIIGFAFKSLEKTGLWQPKE